MDTIAYLEKLDDTYYRTVPEFTDLLRLYSARDLYLCYQRRYIAETGIDVYDVNDECQCFSRRI